MKMCQIGDSFLCHLSICPVKSRSGKVEMIILDFDDPSKIIEEEEHKIGGGKSKSTCSHL